MQTSAPYMWLRAPRRSVRRIEDADYNEMWRRIGDVLKSIRPSERHRHLDEWECPKPHRTNYLGCAVSFLDSKTWLPHFIMLFIVDSGK